MTKIGVTTQKRQTSFLQIGALVSTDGRYDQTFLANYLDINVIPQIKRIEGVGDVMELGDTYSMRIWLKPERMAQYGLVPSDAPWMGWPVGMPPPYWASRTSKRLPVRWARIQRTCSSLR